MMHSPEFSILEDDLKMKFQKFVLGVMTFPVFDLGAGIGRFVLLRSDAALMFFVNSCVGVVEPRGSVGGYCGSDPSSGSSS